MGSPGRGSPVSRPDTIAETGRPDIMDLRSLEWRPGTTDCIGRAGLLASPTGGTDRPVTTLGTLRGGLPASRATVPADRTHRNFGSDRHYGLNSTAAAVLAPRYSEE